MDSLIDHIYIFWKKNKLNDATSWLKNSDLSSLSSAELNPFFSSKQLIRIPNDIVIICGNPKKWTIENKNINKYDKNLDFSKKLEYFKDKIVQGSNNLYILIEINKTLKEKIPENFYPFKGRLIYHFLINYFDMMTIDSNSFFIEFLDQKNGFLPVLKNCKKTIVSHYKKNKKINKIGYKKIKYLKKNILDIKTIENEIREINIIFLKLKKNRNITAAHRIEEWTNNAIFDPINIEEINLIFKKTFNLLNKFDLILNNRTFQSPEDQNTIKFNDYEIIDMINLLIFSNINSYLENIDFFKNYKYSNKYNYIHQAETIFFDEKNSLHRKRLDLINTLKLIKNQS